ATDCYFRPYQIVYDSNGEETKKYEENGEYGYHKIRDDLYNTFSVMTDYDLDENDKPKKDAQGNYIFKVMYDEYGKLLYSANRAFNEDFSTAKPSFAFAGEIFTSCKEDEEKGTKTYYVDDYMCPVSSTFYHGVGNDINLYGIFSMQGYNLDNELFTPYVTVKDGYIIESGFYFYLGSLYGLVTIKYNNFNEAKLPDDVEINLTTREIPTKWEELTIQVSAESGSTEDDVERNALAYLKEYFRDDGIGDKLPFFGNVLGDTYGFGLTTLHTMGGRAYKSIVFYYDVPLDTDYTIDSSLKAVNEYIVSLGFEKNAMGEYVKGDSIVQAGDWSLDLLIYVRSGIANIVEE
ncbi:MAG: hypothetical protein MJ072_06120, partial [Clostridia bacterium]|nr:hypothetical protein [Clostridia bacterium]